MAWDLNKDSLKRIKAYADIGATQKDIYTAIGVPEGTWKRWISRGKEIEREYEAGTRKLENCSVFERIRYELWQIIKQGKAICILNNLGLVQSHAKRNFQAAKFMLEVNSETYRVQQKVAMDVNVVSRDLDEEEARRIREEAADLAPEVIEEIKRQHEEDQKDAGNGRDSESDTE
jgi:hypothetical protein